MVTNLQTYCFTVVQPLIMSIAVVFFYLSVAFQFAESGQSESDSQWLQYRRDPALTGH